MSRKEILVNIHNNQILKIKNIQKTLCNLPKILTSEQQKLFNVAKPKSTCYNIKVNGFTKRR